MAIYRVQGKGGVMDPEDFYDFEDMEVCPNCMGDRTVPCHCGGDLCVCENYGDADCPTCGGEGEVTHERAERYLESIRRQREMLAEIMKGQDK